MSLECFITVDIHHLSDQSLCTTLGFASIGALLKVLDDTGTVAGFPKKLNPQSQMKVQEGSKGSERKGTEENNVEGEQMYLLTL